MSTGGTSMGFPKGQRVFLPVSPSPGPLLSLLPMSPSQTRHFQAGAVAAAQHHPHLTGTPTGTAGPGKHWGAFPSPLQWLQAGITGSTRIRLSLLLVLKVEQSRDELQGARSCPGRPMGCHQRGGMHSAPGETLSGSGREFKFRNRIEVLQYFSTP